MMDGWIKLHRQIIDNELWQMERFSRAQAWIDLLLLANHKPQTIFLRGVEFSLERGQLAWSQVSLAERWRWNERTVDKFLKWLENRQMIQSGRSNITTVVTVTNYSRYQDCTEQNTEQSTERIQSRVQTDKNDKNVKNEKKNINTLPTSGELEELLKEGADIKYEFQLLGLEVYEFVGSPEGKKGECFRLAKYYPDYCIRAMSEIKILPGVKSRWRMFVWLVNNYIKKHGAGKVRQQN